MQYSVKIQFQRYFNDILKAHIETINSSIDALYGYLSCHACLMNAVE